MIGERRTLAVIFSSILLLATATTRGADFYVDPAYAGSGSGQTDPFPTLGAATAAANTAAGSHNVYIAEGTYADIANGGLEDFDAGGSNGISVTRKINFYGGYAGYEGGATFDWSTRQPRTSFIDLEGGNARAFVNNYGTHVSTGPLFDGLAFQNANHSGDGGALLSSGGYGTTMFVNDCLFQDNTTSSSGGAVYLSASASSGWIRNSDFQNNTAANGGALYWSPAYQHTHEVTDSRFEGNSATGAGGAIYVNEHSNSGVEPFIKKSRFIGNTAGSGGGALFNRNGAGVEPLSVYQSLFSGNSAPVGAAAGGSSFWHGEYYFENILATNNTGGYAFYAQGNRVSGDYAFEFAHATVADNPGGGIYSRGDGLGLRVLNSILANNGSTGINYNQSGGPAAELDYNDVWGHTTNYAGDASAGGNSMTQDPLFLDPTAGDFHLTEDSPVIDSGIDLGVNIDLDENPRPKGSGPEMGAFETPEPVAGYLLIIGVIMLLSTRAPHRS